MLYRLERVVDPCKGLGYSAYAKNLNQNTHPALCHNWDTKVGWPLQILECPIAGKLMERQLLAPATWIHPRPGHIRDPFLREITLEYCAKGQTEHSYLIFGCSSLEQLNVWFPEPIRKIMIEEFGFGLKKYIAKKEWHGLRQSMLDSRTVVRVYDIDMDR